MHLSRPVKLFVGLLTVWPLVYMLLFFCFVVASVIWAEFGGSAGRRIPGLFIGMVLLAVAHVGTLLLMSAMTIFYVVYVVKTDRVPQDQKVLWAALIALLNLMAMPVFYVLYVWPEQWPPEWALKRRTAAET